MLELQRTKPLKLGHGNGFWLKRDSFHKAVGRRVNWRKEYKTELDLYTTENKDFPSLKHG